VQGFSSEDGKGSSPSIGLSPLNYITALRTNGLNGVY
jgi:hypothetical protein